MNSVPNGAETPTGSIALSLSASLLESLKKAPFEGQVATVSRKAANLLDPQGQVISLVAPEVGNGPFSIVLPPSAWGSALLQPGDAVRADHRWLRLPEQWIDLRQARSWSAKLSLPYRYHRLPRAFRLSVDRELRPFAAWPSPLAVPPTSAPSTSAPSTPEVRRTPPRLWQAPLKRAADDLQRALAAGQQGLEQAVEQLIGLGPGLTPSGDDYLLGTMVAVALLNPERSSHGRATTAAEKGTQESQGKNLENNLNAAVLARLDAGAPGRRTSTTALSAAFLVAASRNEVSEPWHDLLDAMATGCLEDLPHHLEALESKGASSGRDALAGFAQTLLGDHSFASKNHSLQASKASPAVVATS
ncbi:MAG: DUF2877 domain-containing protein [Deltaproteobacteria bacterium]|nr:DUF2877 domain-containing protein [Deltaproteobacteria bacterium]